MAAIAQELRAQGDGPWSVKLEWEDDKSLLREPRPTQVDAIAFGTKAAILFEVKFTEPDGGSCSQTNPLGKGANQGERPLFVDPDARTAIGGRYNSQELRNGWREAAEAIGLGHVKMYEGTKHSTLTAARRTGASLDPLQKAAGHKDARSTEIYAEDGREAGDTRAAHGPQAELTRPLRRVHLPGVLKRL